MGTLKLSWGGGKERKYGNEKDYEDEELTDCMIPKLKWQRVTGKEHLTQLGLSDLHILICKNTQTYTKIEKKKSKTQQKI